MKGKSEPALLCRNGTSIANVFVWVCVDFSDSIVSVVRIPPSPEHPSAVGAKGSYQNFHLSVELEQYSFSSLSSMR